MADKKSSIERFEAHIQRIPEGGCWIWMGGLDTSGYGQFMASAKKITAHRFSWESHKGAIPDGLCVLHRCDVRCCVNPAHLFLGTPIDNVRDRDAKNRTAHNQGESAGTARLRECDVIEILRVLSIDHRRGIQVELGKRFGVSNRQISKIWLRQRWAHIKKVAPL